MFREEENAQYASHQNEQPPLERGRKGKGKECNEWAEELNVGLSRKEGPSGPRELLGRKGRRRLNLGRRSRRI